MDDGNNGGQRYISIKVMKTDLLSYKALGSFTLIEMNDATGETLLCICILATQSLSVTDVKVFKHHASIPYDSIKTTEENKGKGKAIPGLPVCNFRGKYIPG